MSREDDSFDDFDAMSSEDDSFDDFIVFVGMAKVDGRSEGEEYFEHFFFVGGVGGNGSDVFFDINLVVFPSEEDDTKDESICRIFDSGECSSSGNVLFFIGSNDFPSPFMDVGGNDESVNKAAFPT